MKSIKTSVDGMVTFWSLTESDQDEVTKAFGDSGFSIVPGTKSPKKSLEDALKHLCKGQTIKRTKTGFAILEWVEHTRSVDVHQIGHAALDSDGFNIVTHGQTPGDLWHEYKQQTTRTPPEEIRRSLVTAIRQVNGVTLRESGGIYWVPPEGTDKWASLCDNLQSTGLVNRNKVYQVRTLVDDHAIEAISDSYLSQIDVQLSQLSESALQPETKLAKIKDLERSAQRLQKYLSALANERVSEVINQTQIEITAAALAGLPTFDNL